jgi:hypothetical protein
MRNSIEQGKNNIQIGFVETLFISTTLSWLALVLEKKSKVLNDFEAFMVEFGATFVGTTEKRVAISKCEVCNIEYTLLLYMVKKFGNLHSTFIGLNRASLDNFQLIKGQIEKDVSFTMPSIDTLSKFITQTIACNN